MLLLAVIAINLKKFSLSYPCILRSSHLCRFFIYEIWYVNDNEISTTLRDFSRIVSLFLKICPFASLMIDHTPF